MHWLIILALLSSTTDLKNISGSNDALGRAAETALRRQIGPVRTLRVEAARKSKWQPGDFDYFNVTLDGASLDALMALADRSERANWQALQVQGRLVPGQNAPQVYGVLPGTTPGPKNFDLGDIFGGAVGGNAGNTGGAIGDLGNILNGDLGQILGGALGGKNGRIGRVRLNISNFALQGVNYDRLDADLGEIRFDWVKALQGDIAIQSWQPGNLQLQLRADQAQRLLAPRLPSIREASLRFDAGRAWVGGKTDFYGLRVPFEVGGRLSVRSNQVLAEDLALSVAKLRLPGFVVDELTRGVNPLYDFDPQKRWPVAVNLQTAGTQSNVLSLSGGLQWVGFNRTQNTGAQPYPQSYPNQQNTPVYQPPYQPNYQPPYQTPNAPVYYPPYQAPTYIAPNTRR